MYKNRILSVGIILSASIVVSSCAGLAAMTGRGGTVAEFDSLSPVIKDVSKAKNSYPRTAWESIIPHEAADLIYFINKDRVMVGTVESGSYLGVPDHKQIIMYDANTGAKLWETNRESFTSDGFSVFKTRPYILILGKDSNNAQLMALDPATGKKIWAQKFKSPDQIIANDDASNLYMFTTEGTQSVVKAINSNTGATLWETRLSDVTTNRKSASKLLLNSFGLYITSSKLSRIDPVTGKIQWSVGHPLLANRDNGVFISEENIILWGKNSIALLGTKNGKQIWSKTYKQSGTRLITYDGDRIYRVTNNSDEYKSAGPDIIQSISIKNGNPSWTIKTDSALSSPLVFKDKKIIFSTEKSAFVLNATNGKTLLNDRFTEEFVTKSPSQAILIGQADIIHIRPNTFYISREKAGVVAYSLKSSRKLWQQMHHEYTRDEYSADARSMAMILNLSMHGQTIPQAQSKRLTIFDQPSANSPLQVSQRSIDFMKQRADRTLSNRHASGLERKTASQKKVTASELSLSNTQTQIASERLASAAQLADALVGMQQSLATALKEAAMKGMISRIQLSQYSADYMRARRFQGKYYVRAFYDGGKGVTLIDLDNGKRSDFLFSPHIDVLFGNGLDLQSLAIDFDNQQLVAVAVGLDDSKYREYVKWKHRLPMTSVLSYDINKLNFNKEDKFIPLVSSRANQMDILIYAGLGHMNGLKRAIASGAEINVITHKTTPLIDAAKSAHVDAVKLLIDNGADVNLRDEKGRSAVDVTYDRSLKETVIKSHKLYEKKYSEIRQLLFNAGAKDSPADVKVLDVQVKLSKKEENEQDQKIYVFVAGTGHLDDVKSILKDKEIHISSETKELAMVVAASTGQVDVVEYFLKNGISPNAKNKHGESAYKAAKIMHESIKDPIRMDMKIRIAKAMIILERAGGK